MSSKSAKIVKNTKDAGRALIFPWFWSITGRLTLLYTLSAFGVLVLATVFLYWVLVSNLEREDNEFLADKIRILRGILQKHPDNIEALKEEVKWEGAALEPPEYYIRILDEEGRTLMETPGMSSIITASLFRATISAAKVPKRGIKWKSHDGKLYLLKAAWVEFDSSSRDRQQLQVALDVSGDEVFIADYRRKLLFVLILGILFSTGAGVVTARKGMHPLEEITEVAQRITATKLHERINPAKWPNELTALATAFDGMLSRLEDSFTQLSQFSSDLAHELRTPINNLIGEAEVALSRARTPEEYRQVLESSLEEYGRLSRMIDNLLFLARAENPETGIERSLFDASKEIEAVREFYDAIAEEQGVKVICQGNTLLNADPILFRRALSNLLSNALQYAPHGGRITISVKQLDDQSVEVSVSDTGSGIAPEDLPRVFNRFYRADRARSQYPQGTGLGLAIVKSIMDLHGGTVTIQSELAKGTTVILRFPPPA
jgi:two-component system heavy metal sensor histidine kinase CusS